MNLLQIAWRNFLQRSLSSFLTTLSLALGVALVVMVLAAYGIISEAFKQNASVGYNLVVGPKGSSLQLTLNSVYYLSQPVENLPYTEYMEFMTQEERAEQVARFGGRESLAETSGRFAAYLQSSPLPTETPQPPGFAIPLALGDYFGEFRVVGTTPEFFEKLRYGIDVDRPFEFTEGRAFVEHSPEHGYFEAVVGWRVADQMDVSVGDEIFPTHGDPSGHGHDLGFTIVGILAPTGTPNDRAAFVNLEGFYLMDGHAKPVEEEEESAVTEESVTEESATEDESVDEAIGEGESSETAEDEADATDETETATAAKFKPLPIPQREVSAILVRTGMPFFGAQMANVINEGVQAQAVAPVGEITKLLTTIVSPLLTALMVITVITCVVAAVGILVSIYNSMNDRRRDIAVMRALGARRDTVTAIVLSESLLIAVIGGVVGWVLAHVAIVVAGGYIEKHTGVQVSLFTTSPYELLILPIVLGLAALAGLLPAIVAYRTDVSANLSA